MTRKMDNKFFIYLKSIIVVIVFTNPPCGFSCAGICSNGCRTIIFPFASVRVVFIRIRSVLLFL